MPRKSDPTSKTYVVKVVALGRVSTYLEVQAQNKKEARAIAERRAARQKKKKKWTYDGIITGPHAQEANLVSKK
jgi:hypothetical protein